MKLGCPLDGFDDIEFVRAVLSFIRGADEPTMTQVEIDNYHATIAPRSVFFKNIQYGGELLDLGAGDGTMAIFREWPAFKRTDIRMYAVSLAMGSHFNKYDGYELLNFDELFPDFQG